MKRELLISEPKVSHWAWRILICDDDEIKEQINKPSFVDCIREANLPSRRSRSIRLELITGELFKLIRE